MASTLRETLSSTAARYHKHPPAGSASSYVANGKPVDAGTWSRAVNNLSVLRWEGVRHCFSDVGPGNVAVNEDLDWGGLAESVPDADQRSGVVHQEIAWRVIGASDATTSCRVYGPLPVVFDRAAVDTGPETYARGYRVEVRAYGDSDFRVYAALTASLRPPSEGYLALGYADCTGTTAAAPESPALRFDLVPLIQAGTQQPETRHSSAAADDGSSVVHVVECYLWIGWKLQAAVTAGWLSASAWELLSI